MHLRRHPRWRRATCWTALLAFLVQIGAPAAPLPAAPAARAYAVSLAKPLRVIVAPGQTVTLRLPALSAATIYSVSAQALRPADLGDTGGLQFSMAVPDRPAIAKRLYYGDNGVFFQYQPPKAGPGSITLTGDTLTAPAELSVEVRPLPVSPKDYVQIQRLPQGTWRDARLMELGKPVFAYSDEIEYLNNKDEGKVGWHWYKFRFDGPKPKLCFFEIDLQDHDVPCTLHIYKADPKNPTSEPLEYRHIQGGNSAFTLEETGQDPTEVRHDAQDDGLLGWKFITRTLTPGTYYLQVKANHPSYQLRTALYDVPPYSDPRAEARVAIRYMLDAGDAFFHNTPRRGAVRTRAENITDETERCITCHPAHFVMLSTLTAMGRGYRVENRPQLKFMMDKLYNAQAPLYGHPQTTWLRFDLAPTNGVSRCGVMLNLYENYVSKRKTWLVPTAAGFPYLVYNDRPNLPTESLDFGHDKNKNFEFDGNRPISDFRVAADSWTLFNETYQRTHDAKWKTVADHVRDIYHTGRRKDLEDRVEEIIGLLKMGGPGARKQIDENIAWIWARQHTDGGWVTREYSRNNQFFNDYDFEKNENLKDPSLIFMTAEAVYALVKAGVPKTDPRIQKAVHLVMGQMKPYGAWLDNKGELFFLPFLETKWAIMMLSELYPENRPLATQTYRRPMPADLIGQLNWLDTLWGPQQAMPKADNRRVLAQVLPLIKSPIPMVREMALRAVGQFSVDATNRTGLDQAAAAVQPVLGDPNKVMWRQAAWALRQLGNDDVGWDRIKLALDSPDANMRRGAARVFYQYFYHMMEHGPFADRMVRLASDRDPLTRIEALKFLWREWYRTPDFALRGRIVDAILSNAGHADPLVRLNVTQAMYTILDENTVQLQQHWLQAMYEQKDRDATENERQEKVEKALASRLATALKVADATARDTVLETLSFRYMGAGNGNDYDAVTFYNQDAARTLAGALIEKMDSPIASERLKAVRAAEAVKLAKDDRLVAALLKRAGDPDAGIRNEARVVLGTLPADYQVVTTGTQIGSAK